MRVEQAKAPNASSSSHPSQKDFREVLGERAARPAGKAPPSAPIPGGTPRRGPRAGAQSVPRPTTTPGERRAPMPRGAVNTTRAADPLVSKRVERAIRDGDALRAAASAREVLARAHGATARDSREAEVSRLAAAVERDVRGEPDAPPSAAKPPHLEQAPTAGSGTATASPEPALAANPSCGASATSAPSDVSVSARAEAIAKLVDRVERSMRSGRPELRLSLVGGAAAEAVTIARSGPREVSVQVNARANRRAEVREQLQGLGEALRARGLTLRLLEVRPV